MTLVKGSGSLGIRVNAADGLVRVAGTVAGSPAALSGALCEGDVLVTVDGRTVCDQAALVALMQQTGAEVRFVLRRANSPASAPAR